MKRCPECRRDYHDDSLLYCLDDGSTLLEGPATEPATLIQSESAAATYGSTPSPTEDADRSTASNRNSIIAGVVGVAIVITLGVGGFLYYARNDPGDESPRALKIEKLTTNGKTIDAAISPDGKYVVYILDEGGQRSVWTKQVATKSDVQIIPPSDAQYTGLVFTPDGNYINFVKQEKNDAPRTVYQMPVLGGIQRKLITDITGTIGYSPDGRQFAFLRYSFPTVNENSLLIANAAGTGERMVATSTAPGVFLSEAGQHPVWSPDGRSIACVVFGGVSKLKVVEVQVADGAVKTTPVQGWSFIRRIAWLPDKSGLLILGADTAAMDLNQQIWRISLRDGEARRITNDFNDYVGMSLAADSSTLAVVQLNVLSNIWVAPNADSGRAAQIRSGGNNHDGVFGLAWTPDGRIVFNSLASGASDIWITNGDGSGQKQLTVQMGMNYSPKATPDGRYIIFTSERDGGVNIWRMNPDGADPKQLTSSDGDWFATVSPDSQWVIYVSREIGPNKLWKVSIEGGSPLQLTDNHSRFPRVSPDGKLIAYGYRETANVPWRYAIIPIEGGKPVKIFDLPGGTVTTTWSKDGSSLIYEDTRDGVGNIWSFPLNGNGPKQLTNFKTEQIFNFDLSADGKQLVLARGTTTSDVLLISNF